MSKRINHIISELEDQYLIDDDSLRPWIIGFSGGKDSTALLQVVWLALKNIPGELRNRRIYVVCNDTLVENGEAIILIGTRSAESATRAKSIKKHEIRGKRLTRHPHHYKTFVYSPIKELTLEEVWYIINTMTSPWGADNSRLFQIYADASADDYECPTMVTDKNNIIKTDFKYAC